MEYIENIEIKEMRCINGKGELWNLYHEMHRIKYIKQEGFLWCQTPTSVHGDTIDSWLLSGF